ncbi:MAG TPA: hypothetical protein VGN25_09575, partial [Solirubrobacteraceae bacterium]|nr:hypothetical protein [Solirubrobacteraceae bacterium]
MRVFTLATLTTLPQARALGRSLRRHQPDWPFEVAFVAAEEVVAAAQREGSVRVRSAALDLDLDVETLLSRYQEEDLGVLLLPRLLQHHSGRTGEPVLHLPSTAWVLAPLRPIESALSTSSVVLVPRTTVDVPSDG